MRTLYTLLLILLIPLVLARLLWRSRALPAYRQRIGERFGHVPPASAGIAVWVHAVSVGETLAALPLIRRLVEQHGTGRVWVTTTTPTGSARVTEALGNQVRHSYAPYDLPGAVARFIDRARPERIVIMETELWPNLFRAAQRRGIPLLIANARLSPRSFAGYGRVRGFARATLGDCALIAAQSEADAGRFRALGAPAQRVVAAGNLKFDQPVPDAQVAAGLALRRELGTQRPVWIAASTHEGEEGIALAAHRVLLQAHADALLILVPRHPQRFDAVARLVTQSGLTCTRRSAGETSQVSGLRSQVFLGDSMGEMFTYLAAADIAFVGGSLVPVGGHNVLEPAALGLPVLFGPQMHNFIHARDALLDAGAARGVTAPTLAPVLAELFDSAGTRHEMGAAGRAAVARNQGALARVLAFIDELTPAD